MVSLIGLVAYPLRERCCGQPVLEVGFILCMPLTKRVGPISVVRDLKQIRAWTKPEHKQLVKSRSGNKKLLDANPARAGLSGIGLRHRLQRNQAKNGTNERTKVVAYFQVNAINAQNQECDISRSELCQQHYQS